MSGPRVPCTEVAQAPAGKPDTWCAVLLFANGSTLRFSPSPSRAAARRLARSACAAMSGAISHTVTDRPPESTEHSIGGQTLRDAVLAVPPGEGAS